jgi:hypothetical protein
MAGLDHLKFDGHNVVVIQPLDAYELEFPFKGTWRFEGLEGEEPLTTEAERLKESYLTGLNKFLDELSSRCMGSHIDYTMTNTKRPLDELLSEIILKRETPGGQSAPSRS